MPFRRILALALISALMLVPAVGRAVRRIDPPNAKPRLSAPYRSVDVRPAPILIAPDNSVRALVARPDGGPRPSDRVDENPVPAAPDVSDRGTLRGPPPRYL